LADEYKGRKQDYPKGSYVVVANDQQISAVKEFTIQAWIFPTTPKKGLQGLITKWCRGGGTGFGLVIDEDGALAMVITDKLGGTRRMTSAKPLRTSTWYFIAGTYSSSDGRISLHQEPLNFWPMDTSRALVEEKTLPDLLGPTENPLLIAAHWTTTETGEVVPTGCFNGKISG